jgi:hypothetical protein
MSKRLLEAALTELRAAGIEEVEVKRRRRHKQVWWTGKNGKPRLITVSISPGDWRTTLKLRASIRRMLRADAPPAE